MYKPHILHISTVALFDNLEVGQHLQNASAHQNGIGDEEFELDFGATVGVSHVGARLTCYDWSNDFTWQWAAHNVLSIVSSMADESR